MMMSPNNETTQPVTDFLNEIFDGIHESVLVVDISTKIIFVNEAYCQLFHVKRDKILNRLMIHIEPKATVIQVLNSGQAILGRLFQVTSGSANAFVIANCRPLFRDGMLWGAVSVIRDVSEVMELTNALKYMTSLTHNVDGHDKSSIQLATSEIIGNHPLLQRSLQIAAKAAKTSLNVLITGETGTGKELLARAIHANSSRSSSPFVTLNCASVPESLFESELFGYEPGAFSGASLHGKPGRFELANNGTLFLDEIGELSLPLQAKLLRVIETKEVDKIGGRKPIKVNLALISATNRDLLSETRNDAFRSDLYYRISTITIELPPLRQRDTDIMLLANRFLSEISERTGQLYSISVEACKVLLEHSWPGNIRELHNVISSACVISEDGLITLENLPKNLLDSISTTRHVDFSADMALFPDSNSATNSKNSKDFDFKHFIEHQEKTIIERALAFSKGNKTAALTLLKMNRKTFYDRLNRYGLK